MKRSDRIRSCNYRKSANENDSSMNRTILPFADRYNSVSRGKVPQRSIDGTDNGLPPDPDNVFHRVSIMRQQFLPWHWLFSPWRR
ncbi:hypothetical protein D3C80_1621910 [compost metagenome]